MIDVLMKFGSEYVLVRVKGNDVRFGHTSYGAQMASIEGLKLDKNGVIREFPELRNNPNWRIEAIAKFKEKIKDYDDEDKVVRYIIEDLRKFGYTPQYYQKQGFRRREIN